MPSMGPERVQTQSGMYPPMNIQRPIDNLSPVSMDSRSNAPYRANHYPVNSGQPTMDHSRQGQPSPTQVKYEDRRESSQQPPHLYQGSRPGYYPDGQAMGASQYSQPGQLGQWQGQNHPQQ